MDIHAFGVKGRQVAEPRLVHFVSHALHAHIVEPVPAIPTFVNASYC